MRAVVQRVKHAKVEVDGTIVGRIAKGLLVYFGAKMQVISDNNGPVTILLDSTRSF